MKKISFYYTLSAILIIASVVFLLYNYGYRSYSAIPDNKTIISEINKLVPLVYAQNMTPSDLNQLGMLVSKDSYASGEIQEVKVLAIDKEYVHIGHGLGFIYECYKTGKQLICPGHSLSHYYVFIKHGQDELAYGNLNDSKSEFSLWNYTINTSGQYNTTEMTQFIEEYNRDIANVNSGNSTASEYQIDYLADAPCV